VAGKLELMMGPMRSNKTAELLRRADMRRQYASQYVLVLKPSDDTKGGPRSGGEPQPERPRQDGCARSSIRRTRGRFLT
jgi:hypothetical protein